jgi:uncharacterized protein YndB with AHSA1/START domain
MAKGLVAKQSVKVDAPASKVWDALVNPEKVKRYMFGATVASEWKPGSAITFSGEWQGKAYQDKGVIVRAEPGRILEYTHFSPLSGLPDTPDNYHTVTIELSEQNQATTLALSQDNNPNEQARQHSEKNWGVMLANLKKVVEQT